MSDEQQYPYSPDRDHPNWNNWAIPEGSWPYYMLHRMNWETGAMSYDLPVKGLIRDLFRQVSRLRLKPVEVIRPMEVPRNLLAHEFLEAGLGHMKDRAATYDAPQGERSMGKTVDMFRALTSIEMTEEQGWKFMCCLKLVRSEQGDFRADNFEDLAAYAGLAGEAAGK